MVDAGEQNLGGGGWWWVVVNEIWMVVCGGGFWRVVAELTYACLLDLFQEDSPFLYSMKVIENQLFLEAIESYVTLVEEIHFAFIFQ